MPLLETSHVTLTHLPEVPCLLSVWKGFVPDQTYRQLVEEHLRIARRLKTDRWIFDIREMKVVPVPAQEWLQEDWLPRAIASGRYKYVALIEPEDFYAEMASERISGLQSEHVVEKRFKSFEEAKAWLTKANSAS